MALHYPEQRAEEPNQDPTPFDFDTKATPAQASEPTLRTDAANDTLPVAPHSPASLVDTTSVIEAREQSRVFFNKKLLAFAGGVLVLAVAGGSVLVTRGNNDEPTKINRIGATSTTPAAPVLQPTPTSEVTSLQPAFPDEGSETPRVTSTTAPVVPEAIEPTPLESYERYGTVPFLPLSYFEDLVDAPSGEKSKIVSAAAMYQAAAKQNVNGQSIAAYQKRLDKAYGNPVAAQYLGAPPLGLISESSLPQMDKKFLLNLIPQLFDRWVDGFARQINLYKSPGIDSSFMKLTSLSKELNEDSAGKVDGEVNGNKVEKAKSFFVATSTAVKAAYEYKPGDGTTIILVAAESEYEDGAIVTTYYAVVPYENADQSIPPNSILFVPYYRK